MAKMAKLTDGEAFSAWLKAAKLCAPNNPTNDQFAEALKGMYGRSMHQSDLNRLRGQFEDEHQKPLKDFPEDIIGGLKSLLLPWINKEILRQKTEADKKSEGLKKSLEDEIDRSQRLTDEAERLRLDLEKERDSVKALTLRLEAKTEECVSAKNDAESARNMTVSLKSLIEELREEKTEAKAQVDGLTVQLEKAEERAAKRFEAEIQTANEQISWLRAQMDKLNNGKPGDSEKSAK